MGSGGQGGLLGGGGIIPVTVEGFTLHNSVGLSPPSMEAREVDLIFLRSTDEETEDQLPNVMQLKCRLTSPSDLPGAVWV